MASGLGEIGRRSLKWTKLIWFVGLTPMSRYNAPSLRKLVGSNMRGAVKRPLITSTLCVIMDEMGVLLGPTSIRELKSWNTMSKVPSGGSVGGSGCGFNR